MDFSLFKDININGQAVVKLQLGNTTVWEKKSPGTEQPEYPDEQIKLWAVLGYRENGGPASILHSGYLVVDTADDNKVVVSSSGVPAIMYKEYYDVSPNTDYQWYKVYWYDENGDKLYLQGTLTATSLLYFGKTNTSDARPVIIRDYPSALSEWRIIINNKQQQAGVSWPAIEHTMQLDERHLVVTGAYGDDTYPVRFTIVQ